MGGRVLHRPELINLAQFLLERLQAAKIEQRLPSRLLGGKTGSDLVLG